MEAVVKGVMVTSDSAAGDDALSAEIEFVEPRLQAELFEVEKIFLSFSSALNLQKFGRVCYKFRSKS
jgi:hypothetical protein